MPRPLTGRRDTRPCANCGKPLTRLLSQAKGEQWYCSHLCQAAHRPPPASLGSTPNPYRGQHETRPCANCRSPVTRALTLKSNATPWYCSYRCMGVAQRRRLLADGTWTQGKKPRRGDTVACAVCGTEFYRSRKQIAIGRKFCSRACNAIGQRKERVVKACAHCGQEMRLVPSDGHLRFCSKRCESLAKIKRPTGREHNGRPVIQHERGYFLIYEPTHPAAHKHNGRVLEHRWIVEQAMGRYLTKEEQVDHINGDPTDNRLENLQVLDPTSHTIKTNGDRKKRELTLAEKLAEYERRFGPLEE